MNALTRSALQGVAALTLGMAAALFLVAGTLDFWQGWTFLAIHFTASVAVTLYLAKYDEPLLRRRMRGGPSAEKEPHQKIAMSIASVGFFGLLLLPALDRRFGWSHMPPLLALAGDGLVLTGWIAIVFVFRENSFSAATIELAPDHKVISTGPYAIVRHPMYAGGLVMLLGIPIALGSWWGLAAFAAMLPALIWRLLDEEIFLARNLPGYTEYQSKARYRLVPGIW